MKYLGIFGDLLSLTSNYFDMNKEHTVIEEAIINRVRQRREEVVINPSKLAVKAGLPRDFVRKAEDFTKGYKYNVNHLNEFAKILKCRIANFFPDPYLEEDCVEEYHIIVEERKKRKQNMNGTSTQ